MWPVFNQIFLMMFLSAWLRRSNVLTGAEWIQFRFGRGTGANLAHLSVVFFAIVNTIGMLAFAFKGIGKFAGHACSPGSFPTPNRGRCFRTKTSTRIVILMLTSLYVIKGGMVSVVITEVMQFYDSHRHVDPHRRHRHLQGLAGDRFETPCPRAGSIRSSAGSSTSIGPASSTR